MALAVYNETWKWYSKFGDQKLKKEKKKIPREESSRKEEMIINVRRGPTVQIIKVK